MEYEEMGEEMIDEEEQGEYYNEISLYRIIGSFNSLYDYDENMDQVEEDYENMGKMSLKIEIVLPIPEICERVKSINQKYSGVVSPMVRNNIMIDNIAAIQAGS